MKSLLLGLGLWSAGCGFYFGLVTGNEVATMLGFGMAFLLLFVALLITVAELPSVIRKRRIK